MTDFGKFIGAVALLVCVVGCEDDRPVYAAPQLSAAKSVTLQGGWGSYIEEIDGARVDNANFRLPNFGGNKIAVTPGMHQLVVIQEMSGGGPPTSGSYIFYGPSPEVTHHFAFRCEAGHTYTMLPAGLWKPQILRVTDASTKQTLDIDIDEAPAFMTAKP
jgi:hypothetical protein